ncbi:hypothetical protein L1049_019281 [Liquidambar formosana]|uniref:Uncharacterized protein n=1 Tax=Liquidambar formosana TaxID=63359 RepID=A0AAP0S5F0_LIQFO
MGKKKRTGCGIYRRYGDEVGDPSEVEVKANASEIRGTDEIRRSASFHKGLQSPPWIRIRCCRLLTCLWCEWTADGLSTQKQSVAASVAGELTVLPPVTVISFVGRQPSWSLIISFALEGSFVGRRNR